MKKKNPSGDKQTMPPTLLSTVTSTLEEAIVRTRRISITAVDAIVEVIESHYNFGLILGALQSGKTTTALALQFAGPAV